MSQSSFANKLYKSINVFEAKLAKLSKYQISIGNLDVTYLSNVKTFSREKPVVLLLHGFSGDKYVWNRLAKYLSSDYQLLIPDLKGHGETAYCPQDHYSVPAQCKMIITLLALLGIDNFNVVGNSMGGMMAAMFIEQMPKRVDKCVLIDPAGAKSQFILDGIAQQLNPFNHCTEQDFFDFFRLLMAKPPFIPKFILKAVAQEYVQKSTQHASMFAQFYTAEDLFPASHRFEFTNTMLIWGLNDKLLPIEDYEQWKTMLSGCTQIYEDLGHVPMMEDPKRVATDISNFLQNKY